MSLFLNVKNTEKLQSLSKYTQKKYTETAYRPHVKIRKEGKDGNKRTV